MKTNHVDIRFELKEGITPQRLIDYLNCKLNCADVEDWWRINKENNHTNSEELVSSETTKRENSPSFH